MSDRLPPLCPRCGSPSLRPSRRSDLWARLRGFLSRRWPYRCRDCHASLWLSPSEHRACRPRGKTGPFRRLAIRRDNYLGRDLRCPVCAAPDPRRERAYKFHERLWSRVDRLRVWECLFCRTTFMGQKVARSEPEV